MRVRLFSSVASPAPEDVWTYVCVNPISSVYLEESGREILRNPRSFRGATDGK